MSYTTFLANHPDKTTDILLAKETIEKCRKYFPADYVAFLENVQISSFDSGFIWMMNPLENSALVKYLGFNPKTVFPIIRTGMGDIFLWNGTSIIGIEVNYSNVEHISDNFDHFFNYFLCEKTYLGQVYLRNLYMEARMVLPPIRQDECYGFFPALGLGGIENVNNLQIVKFIIHIKFLSQI
jgi:hypothetical protein